MVAVLEDEAREKGQTNKLFSALVGIFLFDIFYEFTNKLFITSRQRSCFFATAGPQDLLN